MWSRVVEVMLGCWLAMSPFIFQHEAGETLLWWNDFVLAAVIITISLCAFFHPLRRIHLLHIVTGFWLVGFGWVMSQPPAEAAYQNHIFIGLFLLMFAIIPSEASLPPESWRGFRAEHDEDAARSPHLKAAGEGAGAGSQQPSTQSS